MKAKKKFREQLNKSTVLKVAIIAVIIILAEVITGLFVFNQFSSHTYGQDDLSYRKSAEELAEQINQTVGGNVNDIESDSEVLATVEEILRVSGRFDYYIVFAQAQNGRIITTDGLLGGNLGADYGLGYDVAGKVTVDGKLYLFAPATVGESNYCIGGLTDYTERDANIRNLKGNVAAMLIVAGILAVAALIAYAFWNGNRTVPPRFKYKLSIDKSGRICRKNSNFRKTFATVAEIQPASSLDRSSFSLVSLPDASGERLLAMRRGMLGKTSRVYADEVLNAESFIQTTGEAGNMETFSSLSKVYESFTAKDKRSLLGVITITNLEQIKTLFGKQMAQDIQKTVVKKVRDKFTYVFELDFANIGVVYPDGKKLDIILSEMEDNFRYVAAPIKIDDNLFTIELKSGFALCDSSMEDRSFEYAMKAAEGARQRAIDTKIADYIIYKESQKKLYAKYFITYDIKQMLSEGAFEMEYQPQYNIKQERIEGFEALFRVKKSWNVNVDTFSFITYAERTGAMVQLGDFIFDTGMKFAKQLEGKNVTVSLNVSPVQLMQAGFTENFLRLYRKYDLKRGSICVEITESFLMTNFNETLKKLDILTAQGIDVHLDDFGTEYSSLLYIKKLPISTIKIDKEFVKDVLESKESQAIIRFITSIAKLLNLTTICEGVETTQEFDMLNYLECDTIQGWLIGKSMKPDDALAIVDTFDYKQVAAAQRGKK